MDPTILLIIVAVLALLIILGTAVAVIRVLRKPNNPARTTTAVPQTTESSGSVDTDTPLPSLTETLPTADPEDFDSFLAEQRGALQEFELADLSNSYKGVSQDGRRAGVILRKEDKEAGLVAFTAQAFSPQNGVINAETTYGQMELLITQGKAGIKWDGDPLGVLDYSNQRILGPEGQLLGTLERPSVGNEADSYTVSFFGQKAADITTQINALSTLRWFGNEDIEQEAALQNLSDSLEDNQTLLLLGTLLLEFGFLDLLREG